MSSKLPNIETEPINKGPLKFGDKTSQYIENLKIPRQKFVTTRVEHKNFQNFWNNLDKEPSEAFEALFTPEEFSRCETPFKDCYNQGMYDFIMNYDA